MATTAIWDVKDRLDRVINYASNPDKTENLDFSSRNLPGLQNVLEYAAREDKQKCSIMLPVSIAIHLPPISK